MSSQSHRICAWQIQSFNQGQSHSKGSAVSPMLVSLLVSDRVPETESARPGAAPTAVPRNAGCASCSPCSGHQCSERHIQQLFLRPTSDLLPLSPKSFEFRRDRSAAGVRSETLFRLKVIASLCQAKPFDLYYKHL